jgi:hypothetical protein
MRVPGDFKIAPSHADSDMLQFPLKWRGLGFAPSPTWVSGNKDSGLSMHLATLGFPFRIGDSRHGPAEHGYTVRMHGG